MNDVPHWAQIEMDIDMKMDLLELLIAKKKKRGASQMARLQEAAFGRGGLQAAALDGYGMNPYRKHIGGLP